MPVCRSRVRNKRVDTPRFPAMRDGSTPRHRRRRGRLNTRPRVAQPVRVRPGLGLRQAPTTPAKAHRRISTCPGSQRRQPPRPQCHDSKCHISQCAVPQRGGAIRPGRDHPSLGLHGHHCSGHNRRAGSLQGNLTVDSTARVSRLVDLGIRQDELIAMIETTRDRFADERPAPQPSIRTEDHEVLFAEARRQHPRFRIIAGLTTVLLAAVLSWQLASGGGKGQQKTSLPRAHPNAPVVGTRTPATSRAPCNFGPTPGFLVGQVKIATATTLGVSAGPLASMNSR